MSDLDSATIKQAAESAGTFLSKVTGGAISEIDQLIALPLREFRFKNTLKASLRTKEIIEKHGLKPEQLSGELRTIIPILESISNEDDPTLQEMWANLLAASVMPEFKHKISLDLHKILKQLSPLEAKLMNGLYNKELKQSPVEEENDKANIHHAADWLKILPEQCELMLEHLWSLSLVNGPGIGQREKDGKSYLLSESSQELKIFILTEIGETLAESCNLAEPR